MDIEKIRKDFPALFQKVNGNDLIYFDNAATTLKPIAVINSIVDYYSTINSNVHRAGHYLSSESTNAYETSRSTVASFINAEFNEEVVFTKGTTDSINMLASILSESVLKKGDEIVVTMMEHHSNIVPWVSLKEKIGIEIKVIDIDNNGELLIDNINDVFSDKTKVFSFTHSSNVLGTINPIQKLISLAKSKGILTIIDGAQGIVHDKVDVKKIDCDFYCFSGHKLYAPMGIGVLYGKKEIFDKLNPYQKGGGMIEKVGFDFVDYNVLPYKFEAGTPNVSGAIGLAKAIDYLKLIGFEEIWSFEQLLLEYATKKLSVIDGLSIYGNSNRKDPIISFNVDGIHNSDLSMILDKFGVAVRNGSHCTQPLMKRLNIDGNIRISFSFYNTFEEIDIFVEKLLFAIKMFK